LTVNALKGRGFSRAVKRSKQIPAKKVTEKGLFLIETLEKHAAGAKAHVSLEEIAARLKSCPVTKLRFFAARRTGPFQNSEFFRSLQSSALSRHLQLTHQQVLSAARNIFGRR
jgi:hypothetical protein